MHALDAEGLAAAAAEAAIAAGTSQGALVMKELAKLMPQLTHRELQAAASNAALQGLQACEVQARQCVSILVQALRQRSGPDLAADAVWTLNKLTRQCDVTRQWVLESGGAAAVREALFLYPERNDLVLCSVWMTHTLSGLQGLAAILAGGGAPHGAGDSAAGLGAPCAPQLPEAVAAATVWVVYELAQEENRRGKDLPPEMSGLLRLIVQILQSCSQSEDVLKACCFTIEALVREEPRLRAQLAESGGVQLLLLSLRRAAELGNGAEELARVCAGAVTSLANLGNGGVVKKARAFFQDSGAPEVLQRIALRGLGTPAEERAMVALGQLAGLQMVMQTMAKAPTLKAVIRGGLEAIAALTGEASADRDEVRLLPGLLRDLLALKAKMDGPTPAVKCRRKCAAAVCAVVLALVVHAGPGEVPDLDLAMRQILESLRTEPWSDADIAENFVETLGRAALVSASWRDALRDQGGALDRAAEIIRELHGQRKLMKYSFWFAAALAGLPFVVRELQMNLKSKEVVDAAFCTVIDILDDDLEGDWVLAHTEHCSEADVPRILALICQAMQNFPQDGFLQSRGCHCIGLLLPLAPASPELLQTAVASVFTAVRQHTRSSDVARDACYVFRIVLLELGGSGAEQVKVRETLAPFMRQEGAQAIAAQALIDFAHTQEPELLEGAVVVMAALGGLGFAISQLWDAQQPAAAVRSCGAKAIFEFGSQHPQLLQSSAADVAQAMALMVREHPDDENLQRNANLVLGLCEASCAQR